MSCLCPISIPDKLAREYGFLDASLVVPCGHCAGCARDKRNDWFVRVWSVYKRCQSEGVPVFFITITIDPNLWPNMTVDSPGVGERVTKFVRSWNERFRYLNGGEMPIRFVCSEFGKLGKEYVDYHGNRRISTGALHFHGLIFGRVPVKVLQDGFRQTHGRVDFDLIRGPECIRYCIKYATKDYSINDPLLRARVFCSPGIGDPSFYFRDSAPTAFVLINGFHYRTPRYLIDKQWCCVYGRDNYYDSNGRSLLVLKKFRQRLEDYHSKCRLVDSLSGLDHSAKARILDGFTQKSSQPASYALVCDLFRLGLTGRSHPLLRYYDRLSSHRRYMQSLDHDTSFLDRECLFGIQYFDQFNLNYERSQIIVPLSLDFET